MFVYIKLKDGSYEIVDEKDISNFDSNSYIKNKFYNVISKNQTGLIIFTAETQENLKDQINNIRPSFPPNHLTLSATDIESETENLPKKHTSSDNKDQESILQIKLQKLQEKQLQVMINLFIYF